MTANSTSVATYLSVFAALLLLTAITVAVAFVDLGGANNVVALAIAGMKATLVLLWFMHVRGSSPLIKATVATGCGWLALLIGLTLADFVSRTW